MSNIRKTFNFRDGVQVDDEVLVVRGNRVGVGTTSPDELLDVRGNAKVIGIITANNLEISGVSTFSDIRVGSGITIEASSGIISATKFLGDGSTLSNIPTSQWVDVDVGLGFTSIYNAGNVGVGTTDPRNSLQVGGDPNASSIGVGIGTNGHIRASGIITATTFVGSFSGDLAGNVTGDVTGTATTATTATSATTATTAQGLTGSPSITVTNLNVTGIGTITTLAATTLQGTTISDLDTIRATHGSTVTLTVTVASKDATHRYNGSGSANGYKIDGKFAPFITLTPGRTYRFDQADSSNSNHPLRFYLKADKVGGTYDTGVTTNGVPGNAGAYTEITVSDTTPTVLHYQCSSHALMGNAVQANSNVVDTKYDATLGGNLNVTGVATATTFVGNLTGEVNGAAFDTNAVGAVVGIITATTVSVANTATASSFVGALTGNVTGDVTGNVTGNLTGTASTATASATAYSLTGSPNVVVGILTAGTTNLGVTTAESLGIGTATANADIQIYNSSTASSIVIGRNPAVNSNNVQLRYGASGSYSGSTAVDLINYGNGNLNYILSGSGIGTGGFNWLKGSTALMNLTYQGNLGLGVTFPSQKLSVTGVSTFTGNTFVTGDLSVVGGLTLTGTLSAGSFQGNIIGADGFTTILDRGVGTGDTTGRINVNTHVTAGVSTFHHIKQSNQAYAAFATNDIQGVDRTDSNALRFVVNDPVHSQGASARFIITQKGCIGSGTTNPQCALDLGSATANDDGVAYSSDRFMILPKVSTTNRGNLNNLTAGAVIYNTTLNKIQVYTGSGWETVTSS